jgi:hypothetical protein
LAKEGCIFGKFERMPAWHWWMFVLFVIFFPIIFHPWWMAVICIAVFAAVLAFALPRKDPE